MQRMWAAGKEAEKMPLAQGVKHLQAEVTRLKEELPALGDVERAILHTTAHLTWAPRSFQAVHLESLRAAGLSELEIHDVVNVCCMFAYMNRLADGLGVEQLQSRREWAMELFGEAAWEAHLAWAKRES
jgi:hypothetical protein